MRAWRLVVLAVLLSGCVTQNELALQRNVYQLDIDARGDLGISDAANSMQRRAAELTLSKGYTHYIIADSDSETGTEVIGHTPAMSRTVTRREGSWRSGQSTVYTQTYDYGGPITEKRQRTSLIVVMYTPYDAPPQAIDARQVVAYSR